MNFKEEFWKTKLPIGFYDNLYTEGINKNRGLQHTWHHLSFLKVLKYISTDSIHLDYACGPGTLIGNYLNCKSMGYDIAEKQIEFAIKKYSKENKTFTSNKDDINIKDNFNIITVMGLIEVLSKEEFIEELIFLLNLLKSNGKIVFITPNYGGLMYLIEKISNLFNQVNYREVKTSYYTKRKIESILLEISNNQAINFKVNKILNIGVLFSIFNKKLAIRIENFIERIFVNKFGFLLEVEVEKIL